MKQKISRQQFLQGAALAAAGVALAACTPAATATMAPATAVPQATMVPQASATTGAATGGTIPRNQTLYFNGQQWGTVVGWNPYSSNMQ